MMGDSALYWGRMFHVIFFSHFPYRTRCSQIINDEIRFFNFSIWQKIVKFCVDLLKTNEKYFEIHETLINGVS